MKKGFTIVELIVSFSLAMIIVIFLLKIVINLKNLYNNSVLKTEIVNIQSIISNEINKSFEKTIVDINNCGEGCISFTYLDGSSDNLVVNTDTIEFGNYKTTIPNEYYIKNQSINISYSGVFDKYKNNSILIISIPIYNQRVEDESYEIRVVYQFNSNNYDLKQVSF